MRACGLTPGELAVEDRGKVAPVGLDLAKLEPALDAAGDECELAVVDAVHEDDAGVRALRGGPVAQDAREVGDVVGDEDPLVGRSELEDLVVLEAFERRLLIERAHVVSLLLKSASHVAAGYVGVEQQPHAAGLLAGVQERVQPSDLVERPRVGLGECRDLVRETLAISACEPQMPLAE